MLWYAQARWRHQPRSAEEIAIFEQLGDRRREALLRPLPALEPMALVPFNRDFAERLLDTALEALSAEWQLYLDALLLAEQRSLGRGQPPRGTLASWLSALGEADVCASVGVANALLPSWLAPVARLARGRGELLDHWHARLPTECAAVAAQAVATPARAAGGAAVAVAEAAAMQALEAEEEARAGAQTQGAGVEAAKAAARSRGERTLAFGLESDAAPPASGARLAAGGVAATQHSGGHAGAKGAARRRRHTSGDAQELTTISATIRVLPASASQPSCSCASSSASSSPLKQTPARSPLANEPEQHRGTQPARLPGRRRLRASASAPVLPQTEKGRLDDWAVGYQRPPRKLGMATGVPPPPLAPLPPLGSAPALGSIPAHRLAPAPLPPGFPRGLRGTRGAATQGGRGRAGQQGGEAKEGLSEAVRRGALGEARRARSVARHAADAELARTWRAAPPSGLQAAWWEAVHVGVGLRLQAVLTRAMAAQPQLALLASGGGLTLRGRLAREWALTLRERQHTAELPAEARGAFEALSPRSRRARMLCAAEKEEAEAAPARAAGDGGGAPPPPAAPRVLVDGAAAEAFRMLGTLSSLGSLHRSQPLQASQFAPAPGPELGSSTGHRARPGSGENAPRRSKTQPIPIREALGFGLVPLLGLSKANLLASDASQDATISISEPRQPAKSTQLSRVRAPDFARLSHAEVEQRARVRTVARQRGLELPKRAGDKAAWLDAIGVQRTQRGGEFGRDDGHDLSGSEAATLTAALAGEAQWVDALVSRCAYTAEMGLLQRGWAGSP